METLVYVFASCLIGKDGNFSLEKIQMLREISVKTGTKPFIFWVRKKDQSELNRLLFQVKLDAVMVLSSIKPNEDDTLVTRRKYLNHCLKGVTSFYVISPLKSTNKHFLYTKELTQDICDKIPEKEGTKVFFRHPTNNPKSKVHYILKTAKPIVIPKNNKFIDIG